MKIPVSKSVLATATALGSTLGKIGSALRITGYADIAAFFEETNNQENAVIQPYLAYDGNAPASNSGMYTLVDSAGNAKTLTVLQNEKVVQSLGGVSGKYLLFYAKGSVGTNAVLKGSILGHSLRPNGALFQPLASTILSTSVLSNTTYADKGNIVNAHGFKDLTLFVNCDGTEGCKIKVFGSLANSQPTATTGMYQHANPDGTEIELTVAAGEKVAFPLTGLVAKWIAIQAEKTTGGSGNPTVSVVLAGNCGSV